MAERFERRLRETLEARAPKRVQIDDAIDAAVLIPVLGEPEPTLIFTLRTDTLPSHKGQISFPGGRIDPDDSTPQEAALREAQEEISLDPQLVRLLGQLDATPTFVSGYVITPVVGWLDHKPQLEPNPAEVAAILEVPIADLVDEIRREPGFQHDGRSYPTEAWVWDDNVIWGVTARLVRQFLDLLGSAGLTTPPGPTDSWTAWPLTSSRSC